MGTSAAWPHAHQAGAVPGQGTPHCSCMPLMPLCPRLMLLPAWHLAPPKEQGNCQLGSGLWPLPCVTHLGWDGDRIAFNRRLLSLALGTEMPPPTPATCWAQPLLTPHGP